jgi:hypothetical protein
MTPLRCLALLLLLPVSLKAEPPPHPGNTWGRVFLTREARAALDRAQGGTTATTPNASPDAPIDGVMQRSAGRAVIWRAGVPEFIDTVPTAPHRGQRP